MVLVKILGGIDLVAAFVFLMLIFGIQPFLPLLLFSSGLLFAKSFFIFSGDVLSLVDLVASIVLLISIFISLPAVILWFPAFLMLAKGFVSFF